MVNYLAQVMVYGNETYVQIYHNAQYYKFFIKPPPEIKLKYYDIILVKDLEKFQPTGYTTGVDLPQIQWKMADIEDIMNLANKCVLYQLLISETDHKKFQEKYLPLLQKKAQEVLRALSGCDFKSYPTYDYSLSSISSIITSEKIKKEMLTNRLSKIKKEEVKKYEEVINSLEFIRRAQLVIAGFQNIGSTYSQQALSAQSEFDEIKKTISEDLDPKTLVDRIIEKNKQFIANNYMTACVLRDYYIGVFLLKIIDTNLQIKPEYLDLFLKISSTAYHTSFDQIRWVMGPNVKNQTIDFSKATHMDSTNAQWVSNAKRVTQISKGDKILCLNSPDHSSYYIMKGGKKLKMKLKQKGQIQLNDNTIVFGQDSIYNDLTEIERINALSVLNPEEVLSILAKKGIKIDKFKKLAAAIAKDYSMGRQLADTAIELIYNLDPRMARRLIKEFGV